MITVRRCDNEFIRVKTGRRFEAWSQVWKEDVDMVQETERQQVKDTKDRKHVQEHLRPGFEGGQLPLYMRLPKRGFKCINSKTIVGINVDRLNIFNDGDEVTVDTLIETGIVRNPKDGVKILGNGELTKKLDVKVNAFSKSAVDKIQALGGKAEVI